MKKIFLLLTVALFFACKEEQKQVETEAKQEDTFKPITDADIESGVIYEANIRQYSPEGTFNAFTKDIPVLKDLGVKVIWVMPINPISEVKRKATDGQFTSDIEDEKERAKYLGSYYSVSDYKAINPEFGNLEDFKNLVDTAHDNGIYVIVDWVPNHTGWDHPWITAHPDWYTQNEKGEIIDPINPDTGESWGWTDVADLNYDNMDMRKEMLNDLKYWLTEANIDGYRMDVAHKVPKEFFDEVTKELKQIKPVFMLAEAEQPELLEKAFDMQYAWEGHHLLNELAKGEKNADDFQAYIKKQDTVLQDDDINMNFVTNHDENSWAGTLKERMPNKKELFTALTYTMPGMPLIYSGQEYDLDHRLLFFEKDSIPKTKGDYFTLLQRLGELKNTNSALNGGKDAAAYNAIDAGSNVIAFSRTKGDDEVVFIANISNESVITNLPQKGSYLDYIANQPTELKGDAIELAPNTYKIYVKQ
ncbi:1,4-alpha-glucan branching enzyme [Mesoflavibacter sp. HG96]|uniref:Alpha-amylase family glycosyl hydrolase n=1 Tax=Mesoflavibacter profundi TaxID=2708110 RepID=A0ABT4S0J4_9FLAO|nr:MULTISPECIES: alpha-amylase family glycosyl hydrolase [Mesoflavibacter]MDA0177584.1 alpha-amylase family glycosyl hydrolase [Mesoflavibacter profundi]QIJ88539.1 1,4-alpha-glucan branching enzyme [Mesoflavibacter sp. HG96]QIJ91267.1 1,4-alpha-glucan branching enzyme [Mesoflavibacter sp. HG37]